jgi:hypothetical protein
MIMATASANALALPERVFRFLYDAGSIVLPSGFQ